MRWTLAKGETVNRTNTTTANLITTIADEFRALHNSSATKDFIGEEMARSGITLLARANELGIFLEPQYAAARLWLGRWQTDHHTPWSEVIGQRQKTDASIIAWQRVTECFFPDLADMDQNGVGKCELLLWDQWSEACKLFADLLDAKAANNSIPPDDKLEHGEKNNDTINLHKLPQSTTINYHNHSMNFNGPVQGSIVAAGGSNIADSSASYNNREELVDALKALMPLIRTEIKCQKDEVESAIEVLIRAAGNPSVAATEVEQAALVVANSSPTLKQRLADIAGRIGISLIGSAIFQGIKMASGIP